MMKKYTTSEKQHLNEVFQKYSRNNEFTKKDCINALIQHNVIKDRRVFHNWYYPKYFNNPKNNFNPFALAAQVEYKFNWLKEYFAELKIGNRLRVRSSMSTLRVYYVQYLWNSSTGKKQYFSSSIITISAIKKKSGEFNVKVLPPYHEIVEHHTQDTSNYMEYASAFGSKEPNFRDLEEDSFKNIFNSKVLNKLISKAETKVLNKKKKTSELVNQLKKESAKYSTQRKAKKAKNKNH